MQKFFVLLEIVFVILNKIFAKLLRYCGSTVCLTLVKISNHNLHDSISENAWEALPSVKVNVVMLLCLFGIFKGWSVGWVYVHLLCNWKAIKGQNKVPLQIALTSRCFWTLYIVWFTSAIIIMLILLPLTENGYFGVSGVIGQDLSWYKNFVLGPSLAHTNMQCKGKGLTLTNNSTVQFVVIREREWSILNTISWNSGLFCFRWLLFRQYN